MRKSETSTAGAAGALPRVGSWVWACREGSEDTLSQEFARAERSARPLVRGLVESMSPEPRAPSPERFEPTFARFGFPVEWAGRDGPEVAPALARLWPRPVWLQAWVPDSEEGNRGSRRAMALGGEVLAQRRALGLPVYETVKAARAAKVDLAQVVLLPDGVVVAGALPFARGDLEVSGGRTRERRSRTSPSRAAMKLEEALRWKGASPHKGSVCVDLGAAPGGWTERLLALGAKVVAVDPAKLRADLHRSPSLKHVQESAFAFAPERPVDWLFCDMAWRPLEVAQLLGKWAARGWARQLVANIKLPMKDKVPMVERVRETLRESGWQRLKSRQLYHDRDEITVIAER